MFLVDPQSRNLTFNTGADEAYRRSPAGSSALKARLISNLQDLNNSFSELINFGIPLAQHIMPYLSAFADPRHRSNSSISSLVRHTAASGTVNKGSNVSSPWQGVSDYIANVLQQANALVPLTMEPGNTLKSMCD